jgi:hypothetical protein
MPCPADGRFVAFESLASNLVRGDTNGKQDIFLRDRQLGTIERVSLTSTNGEADGNSGFVAVSDDGRYVGFDQFRGEPRPERTSSSAGHLPSRPHRRRRHDKPLRPGSGRRSNVPVLECSFGTGTGLRQFLRDGRREPVDFRGNVPLV